MAIDSFPSGVVQPAERVPALRPLPLSAPATPPQARAAAATHSTQRRCRRHCLHPPLTFCRCRCCLLYRRLGESCEPEDEGEEEEDEVTVCQSFFLECDFEPFFLSDTQKHKS
jgi:hypothetical protein